MKPETGEALDNAASSQGLRINNSKYNYSNYITLNLK